MKNSGHVIINYLISTQVRIGSSAFMNQELLYAGKLMVKIAPHCTQEPQQEMIKGINRAKLHKVNPNVRCIPGSFFGTE